MIENPSKRKRVAAILRMFKRRDTLVTMSKSKAPGSKKAETRN
jgi:hypothetical protein